MSSQHVAPLTSASIYLVIGTCSLSLSHFLSLECCYMSIATYIVAITAVTSCILPYWTITYVSGVHEYNTIADNLMAASPSPKSSSNGNGNGMDVGSVQGEGEEYAVYAVHSGLWQWCNMNDSCSSVSELTYR
jgi:hypothetical protein